MSDPKRKFKPETGGNAKSTDKSPARNDSAPKQAGPKKFGAKKFAPKKFEERISAAERSSPKLSSPNLSPAKSRAANHQTDAGRKDPPGRVETKPQSRPNSRPNSTSHARPQPFKRTGGGNRRAATVAPADPQTQGERVAKIIARAGACSRRDAEAWIAEGRVAVNGKVLTSPAIALGPDDQISIDGAPLAERQRTRLFLFHKPRGLVTTNKDPEGRATIFDHLHQHAPEAPRLMSVGRLDINTEGLLLLTNDGGLARILELPATGWLRRYRVRANGETDQAILDGLAKGVTIDGLRYAGIEATLDRQQGANCWLTLGLREGKNREIKRVLEHLGLAVNRLIRISFGPFQLGEIEEGKIEEVRTRVLRDQLGTALAQAAGVDFDAALETAPPPEADTEKTNAFGRKIPRSRAASNDTKPRRDAKPNSKNPNAGHGKPARFSANSRSAPQAAAPEPEKPRSRPQPGPRKHISALRAEGKSRTAEDPRQRIERGEIADRKGRAVTIERRSRSKDGTAESTKQKPAQRQTRPDQQRPSRAPGPAAPRSDTPKARASKPSASRSDRSAPRSGAPRSDAPRPDAPRPGAGGKGRRPK
ncbi:MAG: pseudouridine synthase [Methylovirgula sp.]